MSAQRTRAPLLAIACDGGSKTGKTTAGLNLVRLFRRRGFPAVFLSTGWLWRVVGKLVADRGLDPKTLTDDQVIELIQLAHVTIVHGEHAGRVTYVRGRDIVMPSVDEYDSPLYQPAVTLATRSVSHLDRVRAYLNERIIEPWAGAQTGVVVLEGRDTAAIVDHLYERRPFLLAPLKFFFQAISPEEAARRAHHETVETIAERDRVDSRNLVTDPNAVVVNTAELNTAELALAYLDAAVTKHYPALGNGAVIMVVGGPRAGKGTHATQFAQDIGAAYISSGDLMRRLDSQAALGSDASLMHAGKLVESDRFVAVMEAAILAVPREQPLVLDGVAKKHQEAPWILKYLANLDRCVTVLICVNIDRATMKERLNRGRKDDRPEVQNERWQQFVTETKPSIEVLSQAALTVCNVMGVGTVDEVHDRIASQLIRVGLPWPVPATSRV